MNFTISKSELQSKLKLAGRIIQPQKTNPIFENFLFEVDNLSEDTLFVSGSDESGKITTSVQCKIEGRDLSGFTCPAKTLLDAISEIPEQPLVFSIRSNKERIEISCRYATGKFDIVGTVAELYTKYEEMPADSATTSVDAPDFLEGLRRTYFGCANDELRPVMNGVYFDQNAEGITYVATNGTTLAMSEFYTKGGQRISFILPSKMAKILTSILPSIDDTLNLSVSSSYVTIQHPTFSLQCRLIEGRYPNYRSVIPSANTKRAVVNRHDLVAAVKRVAIFGSQTSMLIKLSFGRGKLAIYAQDLDYSTSADETLSIHYDDDSINIGFKSSNLIDILQNLVSDEVEISLSDPSRAGLIREVKNNTNRDVTMLVMPLMLNY